MREKQAELTKEKTEIKHKITINYNKLHRFKQKEQRDKQLKHLNWADSIHNTEFRRRQAPVV